jgi:hypothetical protein
MKELNKLINEISSELSKLKLKVERIKNSGSKSFTEFNKELVTKELDKLDCRMKKILILSKDTSYKMNKIELEDALSDIKKLSNLGILNQEVL